MTSYDYDLFTLGAGSGGVRASRVSASMGARVAVAEERYLGGTCVNVGCVPKKLFYYAGSVAEELRDASGYGWTIEGAEFDWATLVRNKDREIERLNGVYRSLLEGAGVELFEGRARLVDAHTVEIDDERYTSHHVLIATGGWPHMPDVPGIEHAISSNEVFHLESLPERAFIYGGGYIAVEFAGVLHGLGVDTVLVYRGPLFLRGFDEDLRLGLAEEMRLQGIELRFDTQVERIERLDDGVAVLLSDGSKVEAGFMLCACGRRPLTADLGLEQCGVELAPSGAIRVDELSRTNVPSICAIGDATDRLQLTPVAIHEGMCLAETLFGSGPTRPDHRDVATAVFSHPPIGTVGLNEAEARQRYGALDIYKSRFRTLKHSLTENRQRTIVKLIVDRASQRVVGAHMLGPDAGEIIQGIAIAIKMGATKQQFDATIGVHPTSAEEFVTLREPVAGS